MKVFMDDMILNTLEWGINILDNDAKYIQKAYRHHGEIIYGLYDCKSNEKVDHKTPFWAFFKEVKRHNTRLNPWKVHIISTQMQGCILQVQGGTILTPILIRLKEGDTSFNYLFVSARKRGIPKANVFKW